MTVKCMIWFLFDTSLLFSGLNICETAQFARRIHCLIKFGLSSDSDDEGLGDDDDLPVSDKLALTMTMVA